MDHSQDKSCWITIKKYRYVVKIQVTPLMNNDVMFINSNLFSSISQFDPRQKFTSTYHKVTFIGLCHTVYHIFNWFFDFVLYVYVVYNWGPVLGGGIMIFLSLILCAFSLYLYERMQIDWIGSGAMLEWQSQNPTTLLGKLFRLIKTSPLAVFVFLVVFTDAFIITAYFRHGRFDGLAGKDWKLFFFSNFICNVYWIGVSTILGNGSVSLWQWLILHADFGNGWLFEHVIATLYQLQTQWECLLDYVNVFWSSL